MQNSIYEQIVVAIIKQQESIIGPMSLKWANKVEGMSINWQSKSVTFNTDPTEAVDALVHQYEALFGQLSVDVCKEAAAYYVPQLDPLSVPKLLV